MGGLYTRLRMGGSKHQRYLARLNRELEKYKATIRALNMSDEDARGLYLFFVDVDEDGSGEISVDEFFRYLGLVQSVFARRTFTMFDADGSGEIDFREFLVSLYSYCTADKYGLIAFAFRLYDTDSSGLLDLSELEQMIREVWGEDYKNNKRAKAVMAKIQLNAEKDPKFSNKDGEVAEPVFTSFARANPALLFPAFQLQLELQERIMGLKFWRRNTKKRLTATAFEGGLEAFQEFMSKIHEASFRELTESGRLQELALSDIESDEEEEEMEPAYRQGGARQRARAQQQRRGKQRDRKSVV